MITTERLKQILPFVNWLIITVFVIYQFVMQTAASVFHRVWAHDFQLDHMGVSQLSSAFFLSYLMFQLPVGIIYSRFKIRNVMACAAIILAIGCFWLGLTHNFYCAVVARILMGIGSAFGFIGMMYICTVWFRPKHFTVMLSLSETISMIALMFGITGLTVLLFHYSWRVIMITAGIGALCLAITILFFVGERSSQIKKKQAKRKGAFVIFKHLAIVLKNKQIWLASMYGFFMFSIISAFTSLWGITFVVKTSGIDRVLAAQITTLILLGTAIGGPINSWLADKVGSQKILMFFSSLLAAITMSIAVFVPGIPVVLMFPLYIAIGLTCSGYIHSYGLMKLHAPREFRAEALAIGNMIFMLCAPFFQMLIGQLLDNHFFGLARTTVTQYRLSVGVLPVGLFISAVLVFFIKEKKKK